MLLGVVLALFLLTQTAFGAEEDSLTVNPVEESDNYSAVMYDNTNGLPTSEANAIAQTSEGFIWIGSYGGLIRYDGNTFERMDSTTGVGSVVSLHVDSMDRLWIGTNERPGRDPLLGRGGWTGFFQGMYNRRRRERYHLRRDHFGFVHGISGYEPEVL